MIASGTRELRYLRRSPTEPVADGAAGTSAVQLARHLGAAQVIAAGRDPRALAELSALGSDLTISLDPDAAAGPDPVAAALAEHAADVDVVVDYLWGVQAERGMAAILGARVRRPDRCAGWG
jgi:NADPH:quinone reductase-like Zn-dependent oxidoreductase